MIEPSPKEGKSAAQLCYEGYVAATASTYDKPLPPWEFLPVSEQVGWTDAALAVARSLDRVKK